MIKLNSEKQKLIEFVAIILVALVFVGMSRLEARLFELSDSLARDKSFIPTVIYFGSININVILALVLSFLILRNIAKILIERRRGVFGSNLRVKLFSVLMIFALAPAGVLFYVTTSYVTKGLDTWLSDKIRTLMQEAQSASTLVYRQDQKRLESVARSALKRIRIVHDPRMNLEMLDISELAGFDIEYGLSQLMVIDDQLNVLWRSGRDPDDSFQQSNPEFVSSLVTKFQTTPGMISVTTVEGEENHDVAHGWLPIVSRKTNQILGVIIVKERFETRILNNINLILSGFGNLRPAAQTIRITFIVLMTVMTLLIIFAAIWLGFYVTRGIIFPIQSLAEATREVALGNYEVSLTSNSEDETGTLIQSFNRMTRDLRVHKNQAEESQLRLQQNNLELERRRQSIEVILKNVSAGVIAVDSNHVVTAFNHAAEKLLQLNASSLVGRNIETALPPRLQQNFWAPLIEKIGAKLSTSVEFKLEEDSVEMTVLAHVSRIFEDSAKFLGLVIVFDDVTEQVKLQKMIAWREVARRIAHEIKNPITPIKLSAQRLLRRFNDQFEGESKEVFQNCVETILVQVDSLKDLVNEFSKFARLPTLQLQEGHVNPIIEDVMNLYRMSYPDIEFISSDLRATVAVMIDSDQLNRALVNIVSNAVDALANVTGPRKIIATSRDLPDLNVVRIQIVDSGPGIPTKLRERVLEPYFSTKNNGTGLGLAIVNQIVTDHSGYLRLSNNDPNGVIVTIDLPFSKVK